MERRDKLKETFRVSKLKVKEWEKKFFVEHSRKPTKDEMKSAPEQIRISYKNCWKIKAYFEAEQIENNDSMMALDDTSQIDVTKVSSDSTTANKTDFSGIFDKTSDDKSNFSDTSCQDISNTGKSRVWGDHLNKKPENFKRSDPLSSNSFSQMSMKFGMDLSQDATVKTRKSLKKKNKLASFQSFTETLGPTNEETASASTPVMDQSELSNESSSQLLSQLQTSFPSLINQSDQTHVPDSTSQNYQSNSDDILSVPKFTPTVNNSEDISVVKNISDDDGEMLFPSLRMKHQEVDSIKTNKSLQQGLRRKVDSDWLARCTGMQIFKVNKILLLI